MDTFIPLPRVGELIRETWGIYKGRWAKLLAFSIPALIWQVVMVLLVQADAEAFLRIASVGVAFLLAVFVEAAVFGNLLQNGSFSLALRNFHKYLWTTILVFFIALTGFFLLIVPGIIWTFWFLFSSVIIADEGISGMQALLKSREYLRHRGWHVFGKIVAFMGIMIAPMIVLNIFSREFPSLQFISSIYEVLVTPVIFVYLYICYRHLKSSHPIVSPLDKGTGFKIAAWVGAVFTGAVIILGGYFYKVYIPAMQARLQEIKDRQNATYSVFYSDISDIPGGQDLADYITSEMKRGVSERTIRTELAKAGWEERYVDQVFRSVKIER